MSISKKSVKSRPGKKKKKKSISCIFKKWRPSFMNQSYKSEIL